MGAIERNETAADRRRSVPPRVLLCKSGLEEHDRGVRYVMRNLVEAGMEVIYIVFHSPSEVAPVALQEDVDVIGISTSAGGHVAVAERIRSDLDELDVADIRFVMGGVIPDADKARLVELGAEAIFGPGSSMDRIVEGIRRVAAERRVAIG
jgi:methylmalonyl-CoA mutase C-terminal domain/subunit